MSVSKSLQQWKEEVKNHFSITPVGKNRKLPIHSESANDILWYAYKDQYRSIKQIIDSIQNIFSKYFPNYNDTIEDELTQEGAWNAINMLCEDLNLMPNLTAPINTIKKTMNKELENLLTDEELMAQMEMIKDLRIKHLDHGVWHVYAPDRGHSLDRNLRRAIQRILKIKPKEQQ